MFVLIVGSGRVGSTVAKRMINAGHDVSVLDESPEAHARLDHGLDESWEELGGRFTVGTALEVDALMEAGIEQADVVICSTDGDNTNIVVAQIAQKRFNVPKVLARVLDPYRAEWYREQGLETVCPTQKAIEMLTEAASARGSNGGGDPLMEETR
jgi:trk system potassium uptake protein